MALSTLRIFWLLLLVLLLTSGRVRAECPQQLAMPDFAPVTEEFMQLMQQRYRELGCAPELIRFPGRRGILYFNRGTVDGEALRLRVAEARYKKPFVRSAVPLFSIILARCSRPESAYRVGEPLGYVRGIVWHENHILERIYRDATEGRVFDTRDQLFDAYNRGEIDHFLCKTLSVTNPQAGQWFRVVPVVSQQYRRVDLYHYLDRSFAPFMQRFSQSLARDNPFALFN